MLNGSINKYYTYTEPIIVLIMVLWDENASHTFEKGVNRENIKF